MNKYKKLLGVSLICLLIIFASTQSSFSADGSHIYTKEWRNGYSFSDKDWADPYNQHGYIDGLIDGLKHANLIPDNVSRIEVFDELEKYYLVDHREDREKPIIEVLLNKYKK